MSWDLPLGSPAGKICSIPHCLVHNVGHRRPHPALLIWHPTIGLMRSKFDFSNGGDRKIQEIWRIETTTNKARTRETQRSVSILRENRNNHHEPRVDRNTVENDSGR